jgi:carbohydrate kinase (thermoresistant glucokinase family)
VAPGDRYPALSHLVVCGHEHDYERSPPVRGGVAGSETLTPPTPAHRAVRPWWRYLVVMAAEPGQPIVVIMGVSGSGKTTVGAMLAGRLQWTYAEADDFHPPANIDKMAAGHPLNDEDRKPWLEAIGRWIDERRAAHEPGVVSCSGLRRAYRDVLRDDRPEVRIVFLHGTRDVIGRRLVARHGHFMPAALLDSQFEALEEPAPDEHAVVVSVEATPPEIVGEIVKALGLDGISH